MAYRLSHSPGDTAIGKGKALFGDQALNLDKGTIQSEQTSWYNQQRCRQIDPEN